ncbi:MAG TPA: hypothetical protein VI300_00780, partial [Solirubrobacter sp.]
MRRSVEVVGIQSLQDLSLPAIECHYRVVQLRRSEADHGRDGGGASGCLAYGMTEPAREPIGVSAAIQRDGRPETLGQRFSVERARQDRSAQVDAHEPFHFDPARSRGGCGPQEHHYRGSRDRGLQLAPEQRPDMDVGVVEPDVESLRLELGLELPSELAVLRCVADECVHGPDARPSRFVGLSDIIPDAPRSRLGTMSAALDRDSSARRRAVRRLRTFARFSTDALRYDDPQDHHMTARAWLRGAVFIALVVLMTPAAARADYFRLASDLRPLPGSSPGIQYSSDLVAASPDGTFAFTAGEVLYWYAAGRIVRWTRMPGV